jgi:hypothetical protein
MLFYFVKWAIDIKEEERYHFIHFPQPKFFVQDQFHQ